VRPRAAKTVFDKEASELWRRMALFSPDKKIRKKEIAKRTRHRSRKSREPPDRACRKQVVRNRDIDQHPHKAGKKIFQVSVKKCDAF
jgi:hypothetical protein